MDTTWNKLQKIWIETCEESLGKRKHNNRPWITQDTLERMKERKEIKEKLINSRTRANKEQNTAQYKEKHAEVRRSVRTDKRIYYEELAQRAEDAAGGRNMRELYEITRTLADRKRRPEKAVKDKDGNSLSTQEEQMTRWIEHFRKLLNRPPPTHPTDTTSTRDTTNEANATNKGRDQRSHQGNKEWKVSRTGQRTW